ncbi:MAG: extracellular solute-binding protein [Clostridium sp.]|nr:extracellular solute-binding protein [Clostridium sp.]
MKKLSSILLAGILLTACSPATPGTTTAAGTSTGTGTVTTTTTEPNETAGGEVILSTTTSTRDSGLLDFILPKFEEEKGIKVKVVALGTGAAIESAKAGNADVLMVHDKAREEAFVEEGFGVVRHDLMYNDFLLVGDEAVKEQVGDEKNIVELLKIIEEKKLPFVSRGDDSGTHGFEKRTWATADVTLPEGESDWYFSVGQGMANTLQVAAEKQGFTIADRSTFLATQESTKLVEVSEPSEELVNQYGIIELNKEKVTVRNPEGAKVFIDWLLSEQAAELIKEFGKAEYGQQLFFPGTFK